MKIAIAHSSRRGIAMIIVMIVIVILATLAGGFAYSMKVETKLARNASFDSDMELLGRSGVELARYILAMQLRIPQQGAYSALNQLWAGGPASTNELLIDISLEHNQLGPGEFSIKMVDLERKYNLAIIREGNSAVLQKALEMIGVDTADISTIVDSYLDWTDEDNNPRLHGAESEFYLHFNPDTPYFAKNGVMDDISEFLLLKGMSPEIYYGSGRTGVMPQFGGTRTLQGGMLPGETVAVGLVDLFTPVSGAGVAVNANTASAEVLQLIPGLDPSMARAIVETRAGPDHMDGTEDDIPYEQRGDLASVPGMDGNILQAVAPYLTLQSTLFVVTVEARIGNYVRHYEALLNRRSAQDVITLYFRWL